MRLRKKEFAKDARTSCDWWSKEDAARQLYIFATALLPQTTLMEGLLANTQSKWDMQQMLRSAGSALQRGLARFSDGTFYPKNSQ